MLYQCSTLEYVDKWRWAAVRFICKIIKIFLCCSRSVKKVPCFISCSFLVIFLFSNENQIYFKSVIKAVVPRTSNCSVFICTTITSNYGLFWKYIHFQFGDKLLLDKHQIFLYLFAQLLLLPGS